MVMNKAFLITFLLLLLNLPAQAKVRHRCFNDQSCINNHSHIDVRSFERRLTPFLTHRAMRSPADRFPVKKDQIPEYDYLHLARIWDQLSPEFKSLYKAATSIPPNFQSHISPRGLFEIFYTTSGADSVSVTDSFGYGSDEHWRNRTDGPSGVPDYIDEVAFALDSSWSMIVERFGFPAPIAYRSDSLPSPQYKVVVREQAYGHYGITHVRDQAGEGLPGFMSFIEINNDWSDPSWAEYGYNENPFDAVRVTCAHELFHAVQYAMTWDVQGNIYLDHFPVSWIEGTAVLMEDLAFGYVNDYLQYANDFFLNPTMPFFSTEAIYTNSLLTKFLFEKAVGENVIDFIKNVHTRNYEQKQSFHRNLQEVSSQFTRNWADILNDFHAHSYFTGDRATDGRFVSDAELMSSWSPELIDKDLIRQTISPYAMAITSLEPQEHHNDTLFLNVRADLDQRLSPAFPLWSARVIKNTEHGSEIITVPKGNIHTADLTIPQWKSYESVVLVVSNADSTNRIDFSNHFEINPVSYDQNDTARLKVVSPTTNSSASFYLHANEKLRGLPEISILDSALEDQHSYAALSEQFEISFPLIWAEQCSMELEIRVKRELVDPVFKSVDLNKWNHNENQWQQVESTINDLDTAYSWIIVIDEPGVFAVLKSEMAENNEDDKTPRIFPTRAKLSASERAVHIRGERINDIRIYSMDGALVGSLSSFGSRAIVENFKDHYQWTLKNDHGKTIVPGLYYIFVQFSVSNSSSQRVKQRVIITP
ncbi:hypothetical protein QA601_18095 [Chitinispirillales bacterium ANBcel5]|uniref:hypothetical protein n=1 Tax=Cellulosispirillum alkaliphilum TaxID=3039283 RepID=UPI002A574AED|nr:hypothetical protein [Chitinispirillales bacterium ANBcel5]